MLRIVSFTSRSVPFTCACNRAHDERIDFLTSSCHLSAAFAAGREDSQMTIRPFNNLAVSPGWLQSVAFVTRVRVRNEMKYRRCAAMLAGIRRDKTIG